MSAALVAAALFVGKAAVAIGAFVIDYAMIIGLGLTVAGYALDNPYLMTLGSILTGFAGGAAFGTGFGAAGAAVAAATSPLSPLDPGVKQAVGWAWTVIMIGYSIYQNVQAAKIAASDNTSLLQSATDTIGKGLEEVVPSHPQSKGPGSIFRTAKEALADAAAHITEQDTALRAAGEFTTEIRQTPWWKFWGEKGYYYQPLTYYKGNTSFVNTSTLSEFVHGRVSITIHSHRNALQMLPSVTDFESSYFSGYPGAVVTSNNAVRYYKGGKNPSFDTCRTIHGSGVPGC